MKQGMRRDRDRKRERGSVRERGRKGEREGCTCAASSQETRSRSCYF